MDMNGDGDIDIDFPAMWDAINTTKTAQTATQTQV